MKAKKKAKGSRPAAREESPPFELADEDLETVSGGAIRRGSSGGSKLGTDNASIEKGMDEAHSKA